VRVAIAYLRPGPVASLDERGNTSEHSPVFTVDTRPRASDAHS
jgi:hypothetical protein